MNGKIHIRVRDTDIEYEGTEEFIRSGLDKLIRLIVELLPSGDEVSEESEAAQSAAGKGAAPSTTTLAQKMPAKSGADLILCAAAHFSLSGKLSFNKQNLRDEIRTAVGYYKDSHRKNFDANLSRLVKAGKLTHEGGSVYATAAAEILPFKTLTKKAT